MHNLVKELFFGKFFSNFFIILQIAICLGFVNYTIGLNNALYKGYDFTYFNENVQYFHNTSSFYHNKEIINNEIFSQNNYVIESLNNVYSFFGGNSSTYIYGKNTLETYFKRFLIKGDWITKQNAENKINCLVVDDESKLGTSFSCDIQDTSYDFYVCGILSSKCKTFEINRSNSFSPPGQIFIDHNLYRTNYILNYEDIPLKRIEVSTLLVFCDEMKEECQRELMKYGYTLTMQQIRENVKEAVDYEPVKAFSSLAIGVGVMSLLSMVCMMMLFVKENEKLFLTFYNLGIRKKHIFQICSYYHIYFFGVMILLIVLFTFVWPLLAGLRRLSLSFDYKNLLATLLAFLVVYGINLFIFFQFLYNKGELNE